MFCSSFDMDVLCNLFYLQQTDVSLLVIDNQVEKRHLDWVSVRNRQFFHSCTQVVVDQFEATSVRTCRRSPTVSTTISRQIPRLQSLLTANEATNEVIFEKRVQQLQRRLFSKVFAIPDISIFSF